MMKQHPKYSRIHVDGFAQGPVPEEIYRQVIGANSSGMAQANTYEREVFGLINRMDNSQLGQIVLRHMTKAGGSNGILIMPASLFPPTDTGQNQSASWPTRRRDSYATNSRVRGTNQRGTGRGSPVKISFQLRGNNRCSVIGNNDEVLFHELLHAIRVTTGTQQFARMPIYNRFEEFVAITITNMYRSERHLPLRDGHGCDRMMTDITSFRHTYRNYLTRLRQDTPNEALYKSLGALPNRIIAWNPFQGWR